ncbi:ABC transporter ATP-binding protein [Finegoldia magna]|uniref:ABC transporter ATP-binding protein n=1 Tax=Finegoldia magna TaxID=1260 RepID=UPI0028037BCE|nr:ABC transporter ATP-binding protein [Finegoldia magna]MDU4278525.1 ABC transporter ATP-binding protein [Finegoldia magna]MDU5071138.1 ABC transporter ATP-binding protein [Finegoldia magna]
MDIVLENYSTNYFENLTGKISQNCQVFSNKITLDKFIAVLMNVKYANGKMLIDGNISNNVISKYRGFYVVDEFMLYPHLNVYDNLSLVLRSMKMSPVTIYRRIQSLNESLNVDLDNKLKECDEDTIIKLFYAKVMLSDSRFAIIKNYNNYTKIFAKKNLRKLTQMFDEKNINYIILCDKKKKLVDDLPILKLGKSRISDVK